MPHTTRSPKDFSIPISDLYVTSCGGNVRNGERKCNGETGGKVRRRERKAEKGVRALWASRPGGACFSVAETRIRAASSKQTTQVRETKRLKMARSLKVRPESQSMEDRHRKAENEGLERTRRHRKHKGEADRGTAVHPRNHAGSPPCSGYGTIGQTERDSPGVSDERTKVGEALGRDPFLVVTCSRLELMRFKMLNILILDLHWFRRCPDFS